MARIASQTQNGALCTQLEEKATREPRFTSGALPLPLFMCQPLGFEDGTGNVLKLLKSLYGL
jgi:hypothetical protein